MISGHRVASTGAALSNPEETESPTNSTTTTTTTTTNSSPRFDGGLGAELADSPAGESLIVEGELLPCCVETIQLHAAHNPMMVCSGCKQIIKCFSTQTPYVNYLRFCKSRHRKVRTSKLNGRFVAVFRSYDTYT